MKKEKICLDIQHMITRGKIEDLPRADLARIHKHIETCPYCAVYAETLELIESLMQRETAPEEAILVSIKEDLLARFDRDLQTEHKNRFLGWVWEKLTWRIPVYQAGLAAILMIFIVFAAIKGMESPEKKSFDTEVNASLAKLDTIQTNQMDNVGRSSLEDSTLIRIAVTTIM